MDVEGLLQGVIRFSNFMTARLIVSGVFFYVMAGFTEIGSTAEGILPDVELVNNVIANYQNIFDILGVSEFALLLILFLFLTAIHIIYLVFERLGSYIPPAIVPLPGWQAIDDLTGSTFDILREARGEEHTDEENQRLYEFRSKLEHLDAENEMEHSDEISAVSTAFRIAKAFVLFSVAAWLYALAFGTYTGDKTILLAILSLSLLAALYCSFAIYRSHYSRIEDLRADVIHQLTGFAAIWLPPDHQKRVLAACVPSRDLRPASLEVMVPVYGTLDAMIYDIHKWRRKRRMLRVLRARKPTRNRTGAGDSP